MVKLDKTLIFNLIIISLILGAILGLLAPIPYVGTIMLSLVLVMSAPLVMIYLIMDGKMDLSTTTDSIIHGAIIGFCSNITFSIVYAIIIVILSKIFHYSSNLFLTAMRSDSPIWLLATFIIFIGVLCATTNAFTGFATFYIINFIRDMYEKNHLQNTTKNNDFNKL